MSYFGDWLGSFLGNWYADDEDEERGFRGLIVISDDKDDDRDYDERLTALLDWRKRARELIAAAYREPKRETARAVVEVVERVAPKAEPAKAAAASPPDLPWARLDVVFVDLMIALGQFEKDRAQAEEDEDDFMLAMLVAT